MTNRNQREPSNQAWPDNDRKSLVRLRLRAEKDRELSDGALRFLSLTISERYLSRDSSTDEFPLPWSTFKKWCSRATAERRIAELVKVGYLKPTELKGCPATWYYRFVFRCVKNDASSCVKNDASRCTKSDASSCVRNDAHHISSTLRVQIEKKKKGAGAASSRKRAAPAQTNGKDNSTRASQLLAELKASVK